jgi:hypothetical protein
MTTKSKDIVKDWTSKKWHTVHNWKAGTGKFIKRVFNRKIRHGSDVEWKN